MALTLRLDVQVPSVFGKAQLLLLTRELAKYENEWAKDFQKRARKYPPKRPNQQYKRTFRLQRGWKHYPARFVGQDLQVSVLNEVPYGPRVMGNDTGTGQGEFFVDRWTPIRTIALAKDFARGAQDIISKNIRDASFRSSVNP